MPTWPTSPVDTTGMDNDTDGLPRSSFLDLTTKFNDLIAMRGVAGGVCDLDGGGVIPIARIPAAIARLASPALSGTPSAPTAALRTNSTQLATTAFVLANGLLNGKLSKTAAYTVAAADYGKLIDCTGSGGWTLSIDAVATLGVFAFAYRNSTSGTITVDPNGSETIDGVATLTIAPGESGIVVCDGVELKTVGRAFSGVPAGAVVHFDMNTPPTGWLKANGALVSRTTYAALFAAIGTTHGIGDGSTTFALPDLRGEFLRGWDDSRGVDTGRVFGSAQADAFKSHSHTQPLGASNAYDYNQAGASNSTLLNIFTNTTSAVGGSETRPRNIALLACIKY